MNSLARKDFFFCLGIWLAIETVCFALVPVLDLAKPSPPIEVWFMTSLIFGIGGAALIAYGTHIAAARGRSPRRTTRLVISLLSWLGLVGIAFPLMFASTQIFAKLLALKI